MSGAELILRDPLGERPLAASDFPISIGGPGHTIVFGDLAAPDAAAWIAWHDGQLFLQPAPQGPPVLCNGAAISRSTWLRGGDVIDVVRGRLRLVTTGEVPALEIEDGSSGNLTLPPDAPPETLVSGGTEDTEEQVAAVTFRRPAAAAPARRRLAPLAGGVLGVSLLVLASWFLFAGRSVQVLTTPAADSVRLEGSAPVLRIGGDHFALPGKYAVVATKKGYHPLRTPVTVSDASGQSFRYKLRKLPGTPARAERRARASRGRRPRARPGSWRIQARARGGRK